MTLIELDWFYDKLIEVKKSEKEAHDKLIEGTQKSARVPHLVSPRKVQRR